MTAPACPRQLGLAMLLGVQQHDAILRYRLVAQLAIITQRRRAHAA